MNIRLLTSGLMATFALLFFAQTSLAASPPTVSVQSPMQKRKNDISAALKTACTQTKAQRSQIGKIPGIVNEAATLSASPTATAATLKQANDDLQTASAALAANKAPIPADLTGESLKEIDQAISKATPTDLPKIAADIHARALEAQKLPAFVDLTGVGDAALAKAGLGTCVSTTRTADCEKALDMACTSTFDLEALGGGTPGAAASLGAGWQAAVVTGLASYLQQRAQDEVVSWVEDEVLTRFCDATYSLGKSVSFTGKDVFPKTCALSGNDSANVSSLFAAALRADLEALPVQLAFRVLGIDTALGTDLVARLGQLRQGQPPLEVLAGMADSSSVEYGGCTAAAGNTFACALLAVGVVAEFSGDGQTTITNLEREISGLSAQVDLIGTFVDEVNAACSAINVAHPGVCGLRTLSATADHDAVATFLRKVQAVAALVASQSSSASGDAASRGGQLITAIVAVIDAADPFLNTPSPKTDFDKLWKDIKPALNATSELLQGQTANGTRDALAALDDILKDVNAADPEHAKIPASLLTTAALAADLASAQTAQDVQAALQTAAAPLGSWKTKHKHTSVTLNAFVGGTIGYETPINKSPDVNAGGAGGAFAPVGIDVSTPFCGGWNVGIFGSVLDVGQLLTSPIGATTGTTNGNQAAKTAQPGGDVTVVQVLSPGAYLHMSIGNSPVTIGGGVAVAPLLRTYADDNGTKTPYSMVRVNAFVGVDLDLIPIYTAHDTSN